jgi:WS/DGAT/MGAT family acyltransferase
MDTGDVPQQFGVVLELDGHLALPTVRELMADRIGCVPRLRQRLVGVPLGCGGPIWVDDAAFDLTRHVCEIECREPGDEQALLDTALASVLTPLRGDASLWSVVLVNGLHDARSALVVVLHHALADGIGGLNVLANLVDPGTGPAPLSGPQPRPDVASLLKDSLTNKTNAVAGVARSWRLLRASMGAGGGLRPPRIAACSLMQPTGASRRMVVVRTRYDDVRAHAHRWGATTNDAVLVAVAAALLQVLDRRGERIDTVVITVPVSGRRVGQDSELGNLVSPLLVPVPTTGPVPQRLARVAAAVRTGKAQATGPAPIAVLGWLFRPLAKLGGYRWYMNHQRRFHTLVSHLRGPRDPWYFGGRRIAAAVPIGAGEAGNSTVCFDVLSYVGTLTVAAFVDPDHFPDGDVLKAALESELGAMTSAGEPSVGAG